MPKIQKTVTVECETEAEAKEVEALLSKMEFKGKGIKWIVSNMKNPLFGRQLRDMVTIRKF